MKIGLVRRGFSRTGGAESYLKRLGRALSNAGHRLTLFATEEWPAADWPYGQLVRFKESSPLAFAKAVASARHTLEILFSLERILECDCYRAGDGVHKIWLEKRETIEPSWRKSLRFMNAKHNELLQLEQWLLGERKATRVITNSEMVKRQIISEFNYPENHISVIYNGIADTNFKMKPGSRWDHRYDWGLTDMDFGVLFAWSGWERKGLQYAIDAVTKLNNRRIKMLVAGEGKKPSFTPKSVRFLGPVEDMHSLSIAADIFVLPTLYDPFSNACLEALAAGVPVITTVHNGFSEIIERGVHGEVLDDPRDIAALTYAINRWQPLSQKPEIRDACSKRGHEYLIERNVAETLKVLEEVYWEKYGRVGSEK
jgi:UDP-glucose:(heptosyl)LPS alpha-1,3-glucosyltransferase